MFRVFIFVMKIAWLVGRSCSNLARFRGRAARLSALDVCVSGKVFKKNNLQIFHNSVTSKGGFVRSREKYFLKPCNFRKELRR